MQVLRREDMPMEKGYHEGQDLPTSDLGLSREELQWQPLEPMPVMWRNWC